MISIVDNNIDMANDTLLHKAIIYKLWETFPSLKVLRGDYLENMGWGYGGIFSSK